MGDRAIEEQYVCVHVSEFSAQALLRLRPEMMRLPMAVMEGEPPFEQVCGANARALRLGLQHGMTRTEVDSFTGLCVLRRSIAEERSARAALLDAAGVFTPRIEVCPAANSAWAMVMDMAGSERMCGRIEQAVTRIAQAMQALSVSVRVAASGNFHAAVSMAPSARRAPVIVPAEAEAEHLAHLPIAALGLSTQQKEAFQLWGLQTAGELAALSEVDLVVWRARSFVPLEELV